MPIPKLKWAFLQTENNDNNNKGLIPHLALANVHLPYSAGLNEQLYCVEGQKPKSNSHIVQIQVAGLTYWIP